MKETELKPCPFCGREAEVEQITSATWDKFVAHCKNSKCIAFYIGYCDEGIYEKKQKRSKHGIGGYDERSKI